MKISIEVGDITRVTADAIVNAANSRLRGGGGVDGAIHRAGGPDILADCIRRYPHGLPTGSCGWTTAGALHARWVLHVVGPNYAAGQRDSTLLSACYTNALRVADELGARSLAIPAVSAGIYGWPLEDAARIAIETVFNSATDVQTAHFVLSAEVFPAFQRHLPGGRPQS